MENNLTFRARARDQLGGHIFSKDWVELALVFFVIAIINGLFSVSFTPKNLGEHLISVTLSLASFLIAGALHFSQVRILVKKVRAPSTGVVFSDLFSGFKEAYAKSLVLHLIQSLIVFVFALLLVIPGIIKAYSYALSFYLLQDDPSRKPGDCLRESEKRMNGHKMQLFLLDLSFFFWYLLGALCFGIGIFFVLAYHETARTNLLLSLCHPDENEHFDAYSDPYTEHTFEVR